MEVLDIITIFREGIFVVIKIGGPMLILSMTVGILLSLFQAVTQVHEQSLSFAFKATVVGCCVYYGGDWMMTTMVEYTERIFLLMRG